MTEENYLQWENYMLSCMEDSAHDKEHIYRVLYTALEIARTEQNVDYDVLVCACLLHDIGRKDSMKIQRYVMQKRERIRRMFFWWRTTMRKHLRSVSAGAFGYIVFGKTAGRRALRRRFYSMRIKSMYPVRSASPALYCIRGSCPSLYIL